MEQLKFNYLFMLLILLKCCKLQKPNMDNKRHDVYIAGFFPFGKGIENSDTGQHFLKILMLNI